MTASWRKRAKVRGIIMVGWAVASGERDFGFNHGAAESVSAGSRPGFVLVRLAVRHLPPLEFECCSDLLYALIFCVLAVSAGCSAGE